MAKGAPEYYVWESRRCNRGDALVSEFAPTVEEHGVNFILSRRFLDPLPELELVIDEEGQGVPTDDLVIFKNRCLVHSQKLRKVLLDTGVDNIDYYPLRIRNTVTGEVYRSHKAANILDVIHCIDREKAVLDIDTENPHNIWYVNRLALMHERLGDALMFRLGELPWIVIVHRVVKEAVEAAEISGVVFLPAEGYRDYPGFAFNNPRNVIGTHDDDPDGPADGMTSEIVAGPVLNEQSDSSDEID